MEYFIIFVVYLCFAGLQIMATIGDLHKKHPALSIGDIWKLYKQEEWNTLIVSGILLIMLLLCRVIVVYYNHEFTGWLASIWARIGVVAFTAFAGHYLIYKALGTVAKVVESKIENIPTKLDK